MVLTISALLRIHLNRGAMTSRASRPRAQISAAGTLAERGLHLELGRGTQVAALRVERAAREPARALPRKFSRMVGKIRRVPIGVKGMRFASTFATSMLAALIVSSAARTAEAEAGAAVDWGRVIGDLDQVARKGADVLDTPRCSPSGCQTDTNATAAAPERVQANHVYDAGSAWLDIAPSVSLVARDWRSAYKVAGDRLALVDSLRLNSSTRMVLARVRLNSARISPFAQVGLGHWRTDPYLLPLTARYTEMAAQAAGGVEVRLVGTWQIAFETSVTSLYRETRESGMPAPQNWASTVASSVEF